MKLEYIYTILPIIIGVLTLSSLIVSMKFFWTKFQDRNVKKFWSFVSNNDLTIIFTEYPTQGNDRISNIAKIAGNGLLMTKGMAFSLSYLRNFFENRLKTKGKISISGNTYASMNSNHLVILGSPASNAYSKSTYRHLEKTFDLPYQMDWNDDGVNIGIRKSDGTLLFPVEEDGQGHDYALVIKAKYQDAPATWVIIIAGCYMWGTEAATKAITDREILNEITRSAEYDDNVSFLIKTRIVNNSIMVPEIVFDGEQHIKKLKFRTKEK